MVSEQSGAAEPDPVDRERWTDEQWHRHYHELGDGERRAPVLDGLEGGAGAELIWRNEAGGQTWRLGDRYLKWSPATAAIDLLREAERLRWLAGRHPAPRVLDAGADDAGEWMLTAAIDGDSAVTDAWRADPARPVAAIAEGLRRLHALPIDEVPSDWESWATRTPAELGERPPVDAVVVHGDACSPNTLLDADGRFAATVDVGDLVVADRWADLAVASMSLGWNYGPGWDDVFYAAYGIEPDPERIAYYRALWDAES